MAQSGEPEAGTSGAHSRLPEERGLAPPETAAQLSHDRCSHSCRGHDARQHDMRRSPLRKSHSATLRVDGILYTIVANDSVKDEAVAASPEPDSYAIFKKTERSGHILNGPVRQRTHKSLFEALESVDINMVDHLPGPETIDSMNSGSVRLRFIVSKLERGEEVPRETLVSNLKYAAHVLETIFHDELRRLTDEDDELSEVEPNAVPNEVREWLTQTFTRSLSNVKRRSDDKPRFRSVAHAIRAGIVVEKIYRRMSSLLTGYAPSPCYGLLKTISEWNFDIFSLNEASGGSGLRCVAIELMQRYSLLTKFKVSQPCMQSFLDAMEAGYSKHRNPYHNLVHAADVLQTLYQVLVSSSLLNWLTDLELYAALIAAVIHDYEHTGTTNNFHVQSGSEVAMLYNDRSVLENHHISAAFRVISREESGILASFDRTQYKEFREIVIEMVLATDMSMHFQQIKNMKNMIAMPDTIDKIKAMSLILHCADISHPGKAWRLHHVWTEQLMEEFFKQGDRERDLGLPFSPLCDRTNTLVAESQIGFIDFIVEPTLTVMGDMLEKILQAADEEATLSRPTTPEQRPASASSGKSRRTVNRPWATCLENNKAKWKEMALQEKDKKEQQQAAAALALPSTQEE